MKVSSKSNGKEPIVMDYANLVVNISTLLATVIGIILNQKIAKK